MKQQKFPMMTIISVLTFGYIVNDLGIIPAVKPAVSDLNNVPLATAEPGYIWLVITALIIAVLSPP